MKATFTGKIGSINRPRMSDTFRITDEMVSINLDMAGTVADTVLTAKSAHFNGTLQLKQLVADKMRFGTKITITIEDDDEAPEVDDADIILSEAGV